MGLMKKAGSVEDKRTRREQNREEQTSEDVCKYYPSGRKPKRNKSGMKYFKGR